MKQKERLDKLMTALGLTDTRNKAQALIMAGKVRVDGQVVTKAGAMFGSGANITLSDTFTWAGRGALKLLRAFDAFGLDVTGRTCADFGASTGGFTDVLLSRGARKVYAIDVGYGQLIWRLASDERVVVMDRTNARYLTRGDFPEDIDMSVCDVSFISLKLILPVIASVSDEAVVLIKPQFEAGRDRVSRGIIRDRAIHVDVLEDMLKFIHDDTEFSVAGLTHSPIKGTEGNIEFLCWLKRDYPEIDLNIDDIVSNAHENFQEVAQSK